MNEVIKMRIHISVETPGKNQIIYTHDGNGVKTVEDMYAIFDEIKTVIPREVE